MMEVFCYIDSLFDVMSHCNVENYVYGLGLVTIPEYRGKGIATEILIARIPLLKFLGLTTTSTIFTAVGSQKAAKSAGFEENVSISYADLQKMYPHLDFSHALTGYCKTLALKI